MNNNSLRSRFARLGLSIVMMAVLSCQKSDQAAVLQPSTGENPNFTNSVHAANSTNSTSTTFRHPGVVDTKASLDLIASQANAGNSLRLTGYNTVPGYMGSTPMPASFPAVVYAVASGSSPTEDQIRRDAILAYACALRWVKTGHAEYANQAKQILNGWAYNFQRYESSATPSQTYLEAAWVAPSFVATAEIIRHYQVNGGTVGAGWSSTDITRFETFLNNLKDNYIRYVSSTNNGMPNNWYVSGAYARLAIGVFVSSRTVYDNAYNDLLAWMPQLFYTGGALKELRDRDCHHPQYSLTGLSYAAEIARNQGNNAVYEYNSQLIRIGWEKFEDAVAGGYSRDCSTAAIYPGIETAYNYYQTSKLGVLRDRQDPYGVSSDKTFLGFTSFTHRDIGR